MIKKQGKIQNGMRFLLWLCVASLMAACASMGRPEGGPRDETPPVFLRSDPAPSATGVNRNKLSAWFDENIQLEDAFSKVVVSPAQKTPPQVSANGRHLSVELRDTLIPNTTYTIDFADAIKDLNEGNILDGFALDFSTGDSVDSLRISGMVLQAENLEPAQGMLVGVYSNLSDTAVHTLPLERIARTNQLGQFTIRNLKPGSYRVFAVNDLNRDYHWDRSEDIAFYDSLVVPTTENISVTDTLFAINGEDSIVTHPGIRYLPNDILLTWFNVGYKPLYLLDYKRETRRKIDITFAAPADSLPKITIVSGAPGIGRDISEWAVLSKNSTQDTLHYWIHDPEVFAADSLRVAMTYLKTDTTDRITWTTDTLRFFFKDKKDKKDKDKKKKEEKSEPRFSVDSITGDTTFLPPADFEYLNISAVSGTQQELNKPLIIGADVPVFAFDSTAIRLEEEKDTLWYPAKFTMRPDSISPLQRRVIESAWTPGAKYRLTIDTLAVTSYYGTFNKPFKHEFSVKNEEDYSSIKFILPGTDSVQAVVQLLNGSDAPQYTGIKPVGSNEVKIPFVNPGTYYARLFIDSNRNGRWDTGAFTDSVFSQPEEVYYFNKKLVLKKNWDVEQSWNIDELEIDIQKPNAIKKNKPKKKRGEAEPVEDEEDDGLYDENYNPFDKTGRNERGQRTNNTGQRSTNRGGLRNSGGANRLSR